MIPAKRFFSAFLISIYLGYNGYQKRSLCLSGSIAAMLVGVISFSVSTRFGILLILFYKSSSLLTKYKDKEKLQLDDHHVEGGQRNYVQVFSCSIVATALAVIFFLQVGEDCAVNFSQNATASFLLCSYIGHYACANGDTWASEVGVLSHARPRLITSFCLRQVPHGTNGGVSWLGTCAAVLGGAFIGAAFYLFSLILGLQDPKDTSQLSAIPLGAFAGLLGSSIDSLLGATLQATYYDREKKCITTLDKSNQSKEVEHICGVDILSNEQVNFVSVLFTTFLCGFSGKLFFK